MNKKGFATLAIVLIIVAVLVAGGIWYYEAQLASTSQPQNNIYQPGVASTSIPGSITLPSNVTTSAATEASTTVGPITIQPLTPIVTADQPSADASNSVIMVGPNTDQPLGNDQLWNSIIALDPEIASRNDIDQKTALFEVWWASDDNAEALYAMTPTGSNCATTYGEEGGFDCDNAELKFINTKTGTVDITLGKSLAAQGIGEVFLLENDDAFLIFYGSQVDQFSTFNFGGKQTVKSVSQPWIYSYISNEYLAQYDTKKGSLSIENLINHKVITCSASNKQIQNTFLASFNSGEFINGGQPFAIAPDGNKFVYDLGLNQFLWSDVSNNWINDSAPDCFANAHVVQVAGANNIYGMIQEGGWYDNARYYAYAGSGNDSGSFVYDLQTQKQIFGGNFPTMTTVGASSNSGYHDTQNLGYKNWQLQTVSDGVGGINLYAVNDLGNKYLIHHYVGSPADYYDATYPSRIWVEISSDTVQKNMFHLLILNGYTLEQVLDIKLND